MFACFRHLLGKCYLTISKIVSSNSIPGSFHPFNGDVFLNYSKISTLILTNTSFRPLIEEMFLSFSILSRKIAEFGFVIREILQVYQSSLRKCSFHARCGPPVEITPDGTHDIASGLDESKRQNKLKQTKTSQLLLKEEDCPKAVKSH